MAWVKEHAQKGNVGKPGNYLEGRQDWPPAPPTAPSGTEELVRFLVKDEAHVRGVLTGKW